jgi:hypothetical protein
MKIEDRVYEKCKCCGTNVKLIKEEIYRCDNCEKELDVNHIPLDFTVFYKDGRTTRYDVCSWKCFAAIIKTVKSDYFVNMPMLHYDKDEYPKGAYAKDFLALLK